LRNKIFVVLGHPVYSMCYSSRSWDTIFSLCFLFIFFILLLN
jgi:hypothetical protein